MPEYLLLLHEDPKVFEGVTGEQIHQIIARYKSWRESLVTQGLKPGGKKLRDGAGRVMRGRGAQLRVSDGPYSEAREVVGGFFIFTAASFDQAVEVSRQCPHLDFGAIEIREVEET